MKTKKRGCKDIERKVPRLLIQKGIEKCKENIADYLQDAQLIAKTGRLSHAIISLEFALEEFGKILLIKETQKNDPKDPLEINGKDFCDHKGKADRALKVLDPYGNFRVLFQGYFLNFFQILPIGYSGEAIISDKLRLDCAFIDFINGEWTNGRMISPSCFQEFVTIIEKGLNNV